MFERQIIPQIIPQMLDTSEGSVVRYVTVNKFTEESYHKFGRDCESVLNTGQDFLPVVIDSYGGFVYSLLGMADFLKSCPVKVVTICESKCMSCGAILFSCGSDRYMAPNCTVMVHEVSSYLWGKDVELKNDVKETSRLNKKIYDMLDKNTNQKPGYWKALTKNNKYADLYMSARSAKKHNLSTVIGVPYIETTVSVHSKLVVK